MPATKKKNSRSGFIIQNRSPLPSRRTIVVLGAPRGGTSLVAGALRLAGVFMGDETDPANNEDRAFNFHRGNFSTLTESGKRQDFLASIRQTISQRNSTHAVWGWKDPIAALYIEEILPDLVNPHFILVTRDITASVMRERIQATGSLREKKELDLYFEKAERSLGLYRDSLAVIRTSGAPAFFVSYEKACRNSEDFATQVLDFTSAQEVRGPKRVAAIEAIRLYAREGAVSADLAHRAIPIGPALDLESGIDLSRFSDLPAVYHRCATLINSRHYQEGLALAERVRAQVILGFEHYPRLMSNPVVLAEVEAGMCFMAGIAHVNLGNGPEGFQALGRFSIIARYLKLTRQKSDLVEGMAMEATKLMNSLEREFGR
jgi:hypothetical protein